MGFKFGSEVSKNRLKNTEFQPQNGWGEGVRCLETREALFADKIAKLINSLGGGGKLTKKVWAGAKFTY